MKKISWKKIVVPIAGIGVAASITVPLCIYLRKEGMKRRYDFGIALPSVSSLNYIKYGGTVPTMASSMVETFIKTGPSGLLADQLKLPKVSSAGLREDTYKTGNLQKIEDDIKMSGAINFPSLNMFAGAVDSGHPKGSKKPSIIQIDGQNGTKGIILRLKDNQVWKSGDSQWDDKHKRSVQGHDFVDSAKMILNLNNQSQLLTQFKELHIKDASAIARAQVLYFQKNNKIYPTPFDGKLKRDGTVGIKGQGERKNELSLGVKTGKELPNKVQRVLSVYGKNDKDPKVNLDRFVYYEFSKDVPLTSVVTMLSRNLTLPINKEFIDDHGGFDKFGHDMKSFIWNGSYDPEEIKLGSGGYISLKKNEDYTSANSTISKKIKIFFQDNEIVKTSLFSDGKIGSSSVPSIYQNSFWSSNSTRRFMDKQTGFGTLGLQLNLDKETNGNSPLMDADFRRAISYSINRADMLKYAGWDSSYPITKWTSFGNVKDLENRPVETYFDNLKIKTANNKAFLIQNNTWAEHSVKNRVFESSNRKDHQFDIETARFYMERYKKKHPGKGSASLKFITNSSPQQEKIYIGLQNEFEKAFGNYVKIDIKGLPSNVYTEQKALGSFDIAFTNFDSYGLSLDSYIKRFAESDGIEKSKAKMRGFNLNPAGSMTYETFIKGLSSAEITDMKRRLSVSDESWNQFIKLITYKGTLSNSRTKNIETFFSYSHSGWTDEKKVIDVAILFEKVIREMVPVIPLMEVDVRWNINAIRGGSVGTILSLQWAYDVRHKPKKTLPSMD